ncbi:AglZ/HisF2 family acetamidino modification protein [Ramlibacter sp.]|uniref:AglZ/HisF2 family acetamidino modification protein n=1 Tax=Ramlibacter sp. TaxID=1917967 RepID=UPI003D140CED
MLRPRIIPTLLVRDKGLVKTVGFREGKYVGDPTNAVKIFNEKEVDELMVLDIDATAKRQEPDYRMIENFAAESRMPLCYGGGVRTAAQAKTIIGLGVEKVAISAAAIADPRLVGQVAEAVGSQSVVIVLDVRKARWGSRHEVWTHNGTVNTKRSPAEVAAQMGQHGAGEIVLNSIDNDGKMCGYDLAMVEPVREAVNLPMTVLGGAGSLDDIGALIRRFGIIGASAGSLFVFKGVYKAVLINYPRTEEKDRLIASCLASSA